MDEIVIPAEEVAPESPVEAVEASVGDEVVPVEENPVEEPETA